MKTNEKIKLIITGKRDKSIKENQDLLNSQYSEDPEDMMDGESLQQAGYASGYIDGLNFALLVMNECEKESTKKNY